MTKMINTDNNNSDYINPEAEKWLQMLETTDLPQGKGLLYNTDPIFPEDNGYCCLGIMVLALGGTFIKKDNDEIYNIPDSGDGNVSYPPREMIERVGLVPSSVYACTTLNDNTKYTFKEIAETLRNNAKLFFFKLEEG